MSKAKLFRLCQSCIFLTVGTLFGLSISYLFLYEPSPNMRESVVLYDQYNGADEFRRTKDASVASRLAEDVRVLCWVTTTPENHMTKAKHVKATWGKRCNRLLFMSTEEDTSLPAIKLPVQEGRQHLWLKTVESLKYIYNNYRDEADWFLKADDDTYVIMENLRYMLYAYRSSDPWYFGARFKTYVKQGYMSGGAGYVISRKSLDKLVNEAFNNDKICGMDDFTIEDAALGLCLQNGGVIAGDSRDKDGRGRFFPFAPQNHLRPYQNESYWYWKFIYYPTKEGLNCCSEHAISFHYITPAYLYAFDYLIYQLELFGVSRSFELPKTRAYIDMVSYLQSPNYLVDPDREINDHLS